MPGEVGDPVSHGYNYTLVIDIAMFSQGEPGKQGPSGSSGENGLPGRDGNPGAPGDIGPMVSRVISHHIPLR